MPDLSALLAAVQAHAWPIVAAIVIGAAVRLTKPDVTWAPNVPARYRPLVAVGVGAVLAACDSVVGGAPWQSALSTQAGAVVTAILGHVFVVEVARGGAEIPMPSGGKADARGCATAETFGGLAAACGLGIVLSVFVAGPIVACGPKSPANAVLPHATRIELECAAQDSVLRTQGASDAEIAVLHAACVGVAQRYGAALTRDAGADR